MRRLDLESLRFRTNVLLRETARENLQWKYPSRMRTKSQPQVNGVVDKMFKCAILAVVQVSGSLGLSATF